MPGCAWQSMVRPTRMRVKATHSRIATMRPYLRPENTANGMGYRV